MEPARILDFCVQKCTESRPESTQQFRDTMHKELDKFFDKLTVVFENNERPTVAELSDFMTDCRQDLVEERYSAELSVESSPCPRCGKTSTHRRVAKRLETTQGPFQLWRPWCYCTNCHQGFVPLDTAAEISRRE